VRGVDISDDLLEFLRVLNETDAAVDVVLEPVDMRRQVTSLSTSQPTNASIARVSYI